MDICCIHALFFFEICLYRLALMPARGNRTILRRLFFAHTHKGHSQKKHGFFQGFLLKIYGKQKRQGAFFLSSKHGRRYGFKSVCFIKKAIWGGCLFLWAVGCKGSFKGHCGFCGAGRLLFLPFFYFFVAFFLAVNVHASGRGFFCKGVGGWGGQKVIAVLWVVFCWGKTYSGAFFCRFVFYV